MKVDINKFYASLNIVFWNMMNASRKSSKKKVGDLQFKLQDIQHL